MTPRTAEPAAKPKAAAGERHEPDTGEREHEILQHRAERQAFWRWGRIAFVLASIFLVVQVLHVVQGIVDAALHVLVLLIFAGMLALLVEPLNRLLRRRVPQTAAALLAIFAAVVVVGGVGYLIATGVIGQVQQLTHNLSNLERPLQDLQRFLAEHGVNVSLDSLTSSLGFNAAGTNITRTIVSALSLTAQLLVDLLIVVVSAFWLVRDAARLRGGLLGCLPAHWRMETQFGIDAVVVVFGGYIRGQLILAALVGALALGGCALLGVPFPILVGVAAGVFELIPLAGPFVGGAIAVLFALTRSPGLALATVALFVVIHAIEGYVVAPRVQGRFVRLHPLVSLLALIAGVYAGGFLGAFLAVPAASLLAVVFRAQVSDLRQREPEMFAISAEDREAAERRRRLLGKYGTGLTAKVRHLIRRLTHR